MRPSPSKPERQIVLDRAHNDAADLPDAMPRAIASSTRRCLLWRPDFVTAEEIAAGPLADHFAAAILAESEPRATATSWYDAAGSTPSIRARVCEANAYALAGIGAMPVRLLCDTLSGISRIGATLG
jgi:hypothetical protein